MMAAGSGGRCCCWRSVEPLPLPGQEFVQTGLRDRGDPREDIGQPSLRINLVEPGRHDERDHDCGTLGATV